MKLDDGLIARGISEELVGIEVLDNYTLVKRGGKRKAAAIKTREVGTKKKKKKEKKKNVDEETEAADTVENKEIVTKKKKRKRNENGVEETKASDTAENKEIVMKKKKRKTIIREEVPTATTGPDKAEGESPSVEQVSGFSI